MLKININNDNNEKLFKFLTAKFNITFGIFNKLLRDKAITINNKKIDKNYLLNNGDILIINDFALKLLKEKINVTKTKIINKSLLQKVKDRIIFENNDLLVIDKPYNLSVQGGSGITTSLDDLLPYLSDNDDDQLKLVHRLDKETSGILLIAKNNKTAGILTEIFKYKKNIKKEYLAVAYGKFSSNSGEINLPLLKKYVDNIEKVFVDRLNGKEAITKYKVLKYNEKLNVSLVSIEILTGRTHQIRAHMKEIKHPILGDYKYGKKEINKFFSRMMLHSCKTSLNFLGKNYVFEAKTPEEFLI